jgi:hypothetical protein
MNRPYEDMLDDGVGRDMELAEALASLDPASQDPNYWLRFRSWVMSGAAAELARRRLMAQLTIGDVVQSWARTLVPTAVLTAAIAGLMLMRGGVFAPPRPIGVEEMLMSGIERESLTATPTLDPSADVVTFASESF